MPGPTTEILNEELREIRDGFSRTNVSLAEVRTEVRLLIGITKALIGVVGALMISGIVSGIWWAATVSNRVGNVETRIGELSGRMDKVETRIGELSGRMDNVETRFDRLEGRMDKIDTRFDRLEASITKALARP